jgi:hypothetical protein
MSELLEPGAVYRALQEVQEGADPADVYARLIGEAVDPAEAIENDFHDHIDEAHDFDECRDKHAASGICFGFTCQTLHMAQVGPVRLRLRTDCPCTCHKGEEL